MATTHDANGPLATPRTASSRRSFLAVAGAALSAPLAAGVPLAASAVMGRDDASVPSDASDDEQAIRALNQAYARYLVAGERSDAAAFFAEGVHPAGGNGAAGAAFAIRALTVDGAAADDLIDVAVDRRTATARVYWTVHTEADIDDPSCRLVAMARQQGGGVVRASEGVAFAMNYVRQHAGWRICRVVRESI